MERFKLIGGFRDSDSRVILDSLVFQSNNKSGGVSSAVIHVRLRRGCVLRTLVFHCSKPRKYLIGLGIWNGVFLLRLVKLDHRGVALTAEDVNTLSKLRFDVATIRRGTYELKTHPASIRINFNSLVQTDGGSTARIKAS